MTMWKQYDNVKGISQPTVNYQLPSVRDGKYNKIRQIWRSEALRGLTSYSSYIFIFHDTIVPVPPSLLPLRYPWARLLTPTAWVALVWLKSSTHVSNKKQMCNPIHEKGLAGEVQLHT